MRAPRPPRARILPPPHPTPSQLTDSGAVGEVKFTYADIDPDPDFSAYPPTHTLLDVIKKWNPDDTDNIPSPFHEELQVSRWPPPSNKRLPLWNTTRNSDHSRTRRTQVFNYSDPYEQAMAARYRNQELPFKVYNIPSVDAVTAK